jgi:hypothetical protein
MPRESARSSDSASRLCASASSISGLGLLRVVVQSARDGLQVHVKPHQTLLRAVVDVALDPAQRLRLGLYRRATTHGEPLDAGSQRGGLMGQHDDGGVKIDLRGHPPRSVGRPRQAR